MDEQIKGTVGLKKTVAIDIKDLRAIKEELDEANDGASPKYLLRYLEDLFKKYKSQIDSL